MRITERRLRQIIRSVIKESAESELEIYNHIERGYTPLVDKIGSAYFRYVHNGGTDMPEEWAEKNLHTHLYDSDRTRREVINKLEDAYNSPAHSMPSGR